MSVVKKQQKKSFSEHKTSVVQGISKKLRRDFQKIVQQIQNDNRRRNQEAKEDITTISNLIQELSSVTNDCYSLFIDDKHPLVINNRNPIVLIRYTKLFLEFLLEIRRKEQEETKTKKTDNQTTNAVYNQNNIYELLAKKNIQFMEIQTQIDDFKKQLQLSTRRSIIAEQMTATIKQKSDEMLKVYRDNFVKLTSLLQQAEQKQIELLQSNRFLNQQIQNSHLQFEMYKKNYKVKTIGKDSEVRLRERLQKQYDEKLKLITRQIEYQKKSQHIG